MERAVWVKKFLEKPTNKGEKKKSKDTVGYRPLTPTATPNIKHSHDPI